MELQIELSTERKREEIRVLIDGLSAYAKECKGLLPAEVVALFIRDENGEVRGGCDVVMYYGCIYVDLLWVHESLRGQGYGTKLMQAAEQLGKGKGCTFMTVSTMDWEGLDFYKKLGFYVEFIREGFAKASKAYYLRKEF